MTVRNFFRLHALLAVVAAMTLLAACADDDLASQNAIGYKIAGTWQAQYDATGTFLNKPYTRVVQICHFNSDGTGYWNKFFIGKDSGDPVGLVGGESPGSFTYSSTASGLISAKLKWEAAPNNFPEPWTMQYADGSVGVTDGDKSYQMTPASDALVAWSKHWDGVFNGGAEMVEYNINDKDITAKNWRQTEGIYIYDGVGKDVTDEKGRTGYTLVALPWYNGTKLTNLPEGFCDDVTPEMGWEWVMNYCGNPSIVNNNFFAIYNKYTGILRFFYYLPQGFSTGNDHVWQVSMTDNLATRSTIPYGVPNDRTVSNKSAITQDASGTYMEYVTPWTDYHSQDGLIVPNAGWWAFDVDLSLTRPEALAEDNSIKLQMRSWNTNHTSLYSAMMANIDGEMKGSFEGQTKTPLIASSSKGIFGRVGDLVKLGTKVKDAVTNLYSGNVAGAIKGGIDLAKNGANLASGKIPASGGETTGTFDGTFEGTINMMMNGTINTDGVIQGSQPTVGVASPTFYLKDFETKNSHLGEGVWNLKKTPVVYRTNFLHCSYADALGLYTSYHKSPDYHDDYWAYSQFYFFDPSSIEVELNPNLFPESDIEWMQVNAVCGVRKGMMFNDTYAQALGIEKSEMDIPYAVWTYSARKYFPIQDFLKYIDVDGLSESMKIPYAYNYTDHDANQMGCVYNQDDPSGFSITWVVGRGADDYAIEPVYVVTKNNDSGVDGKVFKTPDYEISVSLTVKLKGVDTPFALSRIYVPEIKNLDIKNLDSIIENAEKKTNLSPKTAGHTELYDMQVSRLKKINEDVVKQKL